MSPLSRFLSKLRNIFHSTPKPSTSTSTPATAVKRSLSTTATAPKESTATNNNNTTTTTTNMASHKSSVTSDALFDLAKHRRTYYALNKDLPTTPQRVHEIVNQAILHAPTSFNSQSVRAVVLFGAEHDKLWDLTATALQSIMGPDRYAEQSAAKISGFRGGAGTVLFFDDENDVKELQTQYPPYADKFPQWAAHSNGMAQILVWMALEAEGLGANLQHYSPLIDEGVRSTWKVPESWTLVSQMVFGGIAAETYPKTFKPIEDRVKAFGI